MSMRDADRPANTPRVPFPKGLQNRWIVEKCRPVTSSAVKFAVDSLLEGAGFEPSPRRPDPRFSAAFVTLGRIKVDSILDHFWTPANTD